jgi:KDO2-lipid IV(A) lauroyltransferase
VLHLEELSFEPSGDRDADTVRLTARMSERLEAAIREVPEQWVWLHDRWKRRPTPDENPAADLDLNTAAPS